MATVNTDFEIPLSIDRAIIASQDVIEQLKWPVQELSSTRIVANCPSHNLLGIPIRFTADLRDESGNTHVRASVSFAGLSLPGTKAMFTGFLGQFVNGLSLRTQTGSTAINPTVVIGEGQVVSSSPSSNKFESLAKLGELHKSGILSDEEFQSEKEKILNSD